LVCIGSEHITLTWNILKKNLTILINLIRAYEGLKKVLGVTIDNSGENIPKLLIAGGMAGLLSWGSIYPLGMC
jgi:hypothetical protein